MKRPKSLAGQGLWSGFIAATAVAAWFLIIDIAAGQPFHTPAFLYAVMTGSDIVELSFAGIALYTLAHYASFFALGLLVAWLVDKFEPIPDLLLGAVVGFLLFDLLFYGSLWATGVNVVYAIGWPEVLAGNIIAGIALAETLSFFGATHTIGWSQLLDEHKIVKEGLIAGMIGAGAVALWFLVIDAVAGRLLFTPAALGSVVFHGARSVDAVQISMLTVLGYTAFHLVAFFATGLVFAALATEAEEWEAPVVFGAVLLFVTFEAFFIGIMAIIAQWLFAVIPWWSIFLGNLIAAVSMGYYLWRHHPKIAIEFQDHPLEEDMVRDDEPIEVH